MNKTEITVERYMELQKERSETELRFFLVLILIGFLILVFFLLMQSGNSTLEYCYTIQNTAGMIQ